MGEIMSISRRLARSVAGLGAAFLIMGASGAMAASYTLLDHPDGVKRCENIANGADCWDYGYRGDDIEFFGTMQLEGVTLDWDGGSTATLTGVLNESIAGIAGSLATSIGEAVNLFYELTGVVSDGMGGFTATGGSGSFWTDFVQYDFSGKADNSGYVAIFAFDGHRLDGDSTTGVFRGWTMDAGNCRAIPGEDNGPVLLNVSYDDDYYQRKCLSDGRTSGTNDFLAPVAPVPLPAAGILLLGALGALGAMRRRG